MRILTLVTGVPYTGTDTSMRRITRHLEACGHTVELVRHADTDLPDLSELARDGTIDLAIGSHAYLSGRILRRAGVPYVLVFSGTDLNEDADTEKINEMSAAVHGAVALIVYNKDFMNRAAELWPFATKKVVKISKGITTSTHSDYSLRRRLGLSSSSSLFLLPAGLRRVKDVLYLADAVDDWRSEDPNVHLAIVGVPREPDYSELVLERCSASPGLHLLEPLRPEDLFAAMREATAVLNTSTSECSPNAVLEAMQLGCPVVLRRIAGTRELVRNGVNGLVFDSPDQFRVQAELLRDEEFRLTLGRAAARFVATTHSSAAERDALRRLIDGARHG